jgi:hypothetical protein
MLISLYFIASHRAGSAGYTEGRQRGQVAIWNDSRLWLYRQPARVDRAEFKRAVTIAWNGRVRGVWPNFKIN